MPSRGSHRAVWGENQLKDGQNWGQSGPNTGRWPLLAAGLGLSSYLCVVLPICQWVKSDEQLMAEYVEQVPRVTYLLPCLAFLVALLLNLLTLAVERGTVKFQFALIVVYINLLAALNDWLSFKQLHPITRDPWGRGLHITRLVMWLWTTPPMVYLLGLMSDFKPMQTLKAVAAVVAMLVCSIVGLSQSSPTVAVLLITVAVALFCYAMANVWHMFEAPIRMVGSPTAKLSLGIIRIATVATWSSFTVIFVICKLHLVSLLTEECLWGCADFLGKVMFSSSLLQGNFMTMDERRMQDTRAQEEVRRQQVISELKALVQQKEQFISSMSHELRTPLNGIIGLSDALLVGCCGRLAEPATHTISTIKSSGARLLTLINDILDAAAMKQGKLVVRHERVQLDKLVDDILQLAKPLVRKGVALVQDLPPDLPPVVGDSGRLMQVLSNLVGNSCKFTHTGTVTVSATHKTDQVEIAVTDTGIGVPEDKYASIFHPFEQVDMSTTRKYGGTGLGLSLVKQLVEAHGGTIGIKSKLGVGTTFFFTLKVWETSMGEHVQAPVVEPAVEGVEPAHQRVKRVLSRLIHLPAPAGDPSPAGDPGILPDSPGSSRHSSFGAVHNDGLLNLGSEADEAAAVATGVAQLDAPAPPPRQMQSTFGTHSTTDQPPSPQQGRVSDRGLTDPAGPSSDWPGRRQAGFPISRQATQQSEAAAQEGHPAHVLSIDDDPVQQVVLETLLAPEGYTVSKAMDGVEALDMLQDSQHVPDLVLLDVNMPGMNGYEVCRALRGLYQCRDVPIIMVSAQTTEDDVVEGFAAGANDYITKPFGRKELTARVKAHLGHVRLLLKDRHKEQGYSGGHGTREAGWDDDESWSELLCAANGVQYSLPPSIKSQMENTTGGTPTLQVYDELTMVVVGIPNLAALALRTPLPQLLGCLTALHLLLEEVLLQHGAYLVDCLEEQLVIILGLGGETQHEQVRKALSLSLDVLQLSSHTQVTPAAHKLALSIGIHTCPATAVIAGVSHPVLQVTGVLPDKAAQLQATAPPGCIHVSKHVCEVTGRYADFQEALQTGSQDATYLYIAGSTAWETHKSSIVSRHDRFIAAHPCGPVDTCARRLRPVQQALKALVQINPAPMVELLYSSLLPERTSGNQKSRHSSTMNSDMQPPSRALSACLSPVRQRSGLPAGALAKLSVTSNTDPFSGLLDTDVSLALGMGGSEEGLTAAREAGGLVLGVGGASLSPRGSHRHSLLRAGSGLEVLPEHPEAAGEVQAGHHLAQAGTSRPQAAGSREGGAAATGAGAEKAQITFNQVVLETGSGSLGSPQVSQGGPQGQAAGKRGSSASSSFKGQGVDPKHYWGQPPSTAELLAGVGLAHLIPNFEQEEVTPDVMVYLSEAEMSDLGVASERDRQQLRRAAKQALQPHTAG